MSYPSQNVCQVGVCDRETSGRYLDSFPEMDGPATASEMLRSDGIMKPVCRWHYFQGEALDWLFKLILPLVLIGGGGIIVSIGGATIEQMIHQGMLLIVVVLSAPFLFLFLSQAMIVLPKKVGYP